MTKGLDKETAAWSDISINHKYKHSKNSLDIWGDMISFSIAVNYL